MKIWTTTIATAALIATLASPAYAQGGGEGANFMDDTMLMTTPSGKVIRKQVTDPKMSEMMMQGAMPMTAGTMMMMHGGKMYTVPDRKMPDGTTLHEMMMK